MNKEDLYKGFWWLPDKPDKQFAGDLMIDTVGRLTLTLLESPQMSQLLKKEVDGSFLIEVIHGYARNKSTRKDLAFTLYNNHVLAYNISGLAEFSFQSEYATTYKHYPTLESLKIGSAFLEIQLLNEWTNISGVTTVKHKSSKKLKFTFEYEQPKQIILLKNRDIHIYLWFYTLQQAPKNSFELKETARINVEFNKSVSYKVLTGYLEKVQNLLSFCISVPVAILKMEFREFSRANLKKQGIEYQHTFDLIVSDSRSFTKQNGIRHSHMLLPYEKLKKSPALVNKWLDLNSRLEPVFKLYFDTLYNPGLYKENAFLNNVAALEIYHRINNPDFDGKQDTKYQNMLKSVLESVKNRNQQEWVRARLQKKKEVHLYGRIKSIAERTPMFSKRILTDIDKFSEKVSNTRHFLTHFDISNKEKGIAEGNELIEFIGKTRLMIQMQVLLDLGLTETEANECIKRAISNWHEWNR